MNRRKLLLFALGGAGAAALVSVRLLADPAARESRRIRKRLTALAAELSFPEGESALRKLSYAERVSSYFADSTDLSISLGPRSREGILTRAELEEGCRGMRAVLSGLEVTFLDIEPRLDPDQRKATAHLTAKIYFKGDPDYIVQEFRMQLVRPEHLWQVARIETVRTMRR